jgi:hypothetical protein
MQALARLARISRQLRPNMRATAVRSFHVSAPVASAAAGSKGAAHRAFIAKQLEETKEAGTYKVERVITTAQNAEIGVQGTQGKVLNFCANNYLGLSDHPEIVKAAEHVCETMY